MVNEAWIFSENATKKKIQDEKENNKKWKKEIIEYNKKKEIIKNEIETDENLFKLRDLIDDWNLDIETLKIAEKVSLWEKITELEIKEIFKKIDEIESMEDVDKYLPKDNRITKDQYLLAVNNDIYRIKTITQLNVTLTILSNQINPDSIYWLNLFSGFLTILDKNLISIQENHIDIKKSLEDLDDDLLDNNLTFLQKIWNFFKEVFLW